MSYLPRIIDRDIDELFPELPALSLEGPKAVGKTETATRRAETIYQLDRAGQRNIIEADPEQVVEGETPILIDEWQRVPSSWDVVRRAVDRDSTPNQFLLTGSATPTEKPTHSGAGRIVTLRLRPLSLSERQIETSTISLSSVLGDEKIECRGKTEVSLSNYTDEIIQSGFPQIREYSGRTHREHLNSYIRRIVDVDFVQIGHKTKKPETLKRWMKAYAAATATTAKYETIRDAATGGHGNKPSKNTTRAYQEILEQLWIIEPESAWLPSRNQFSRLTKSPKHHLCDPALAVRLLGLGKSALLQGKETSPPIPKDGVILGHLFESLIVLSLRTYAQASEASVKHMRTKGGRHEVDIIVERDDQKVAAFEVKLSNTVTDEDVKDLLWLKKQLNGDLLDMAIIHTGSQAYRRKDGVAVIPAALLGP